MTRARLLLDPASDSAGHPSDWVHLVPLLQTLAWVALIVVSVAIFRRQLESILAAVKKRVDDGSPVEAGPVKIGPRPELKGLPFAEPGEASGDAAPTVAELATTDASGAVTRPLREELANTRDQIYEENRYLFLVHEIAPSTVPDQRFDIYIYLAAHRDSGEEELPHVTRVDFFLGRYFGNRIIRGKKVGEVFGMRTSAYGAFLCVCQVSFDDGPPILLQRYVDFAMADRAEAAAGLPAQHHP